MAAHPSPNTTNSTRGYVRRSALRRAHWSSESGFTLIEMLVACILMAIAFGMVSQFIAGSFSGADDAASGVTSNAVAAEAAEQFGTDVRALRSYGRAQGSIFDVADLKDAVDNDSALRDINGDELDWRDVNFAGANELVFQSDVVDDGNKGDVPECVRWAVDTSSKGWYLHRTVRKYTRDCATKGAVYEDRQMTPPTTVVDRPGTGSAPSLFRYVIDVPAKGGGCTTRFPATPVPSIQRNRIVSIRLHFGSLVTRRDTASNTSLGSEISLRSRSNGDYQFAMGCDS